MIDAAELALASGQPQDARKHLDAAMAASDARGHAVRIRAVKDALVLTGVYDAPWVPPVWYYRACPAVPAQPCPRADSDCADRCALESGGWPVGAGDNGQGALL